MKIGMLTLAIVAASAISLPAYAYNTAHVEQFEKTNQCEACDLSGVKFYRDTNEQTSPNVNHSGAKLDGANLSNAFAGGINLSNASLRQANLSGASLNDANLSYADLSGANLSGAFIQFANLFGAIGADLSNVRICSTTLPDGSASKPCGSSQK